MARFVLTRLVQVIGPGGVLTWMTVPQTYAGVSSSALIAPDHSWAFAVISGSGLASALADSRVSAVPDATLDASVGSLSKNAQDALAAGLSAYGLSSAVVYTPATAIRDVLRQIGAVLNPAFNVDQFASALS